MIQTLKEAVYNRVSQSIAPCDIQDTIVVSGSPRSGTTWVLELLRTIPGYKAMNEPLMYEEARRDHGFSWRTYLDPDAEAERQHEYLRTILRGQLGISPAWFFEAETRPAQFVEHGTHNSLVVKFCRLNRMLHWFSRQFDVRGTILLIRHPCAVIASQLRHEGWDPDRLVNDLDSRDAFGAMPDQVYEQHADIFELVTTRFEIMTAVWCLDYYFPLLGDEDSTPSWILLPYERLVTRGRNELRRVTEALGIEMTSEMKGQFDEPSTSVRDQLHQDAERQLSKWRRCLSDDQIESVLRIVNQLGLSQFYSEALEPNYEALNARQPPEWRW